MTSSPDPNFKPSPFHHSTTFVAAFAVALAASVSAAAMSTTYIHLVRESFAGDPPPVEPVVKNPPSQDQHKKSTEDAHLVATSAGSKVAAIDHGGLSGPDDSGSDRKKPVPVDDTSKPKEKPKETPIEPPLPARFGPEQFAGVEGNVLVLVVATKDLLKESAAHSTFVAEMAAIKRTHGAQLIGGDPWIVTSEEVMRWGDFLKPRTAFVPSQEIFPGTRLAQATSRTRDLILAARQIRNTPTMPAVVVWHSPYAPRPSEFKSVEKVPAVLVWSGVSTPKQSQLTFVTGSFSKWFPHGDEPENLSATIATAISRAMDSATGPD